MQVSLTTVIFEIINFLVLVWLLRKILYQPLQRALRERQRELQLERDEAHAARVEAEAIHAAAEDERKSLRRMREDMHADMREEVERERHELLQRAHDEAEARRAHAESRIQEERERLQRQAETLAVDQSAELAGRLLTRLSPTGLHEALVAAVCETIETAAGELFHGAIQPAVQVTTARRLEPATLTRLRRALEPNVAGDAVALSQVEDDTLVAGLVLRAGDQVIDGSARNQLETFQRLAHQHLDGTVHDHTA